MNSTLMQGQDDFIMSPYSPNELGIRAKIAIESLKQQADEKIISILGLELDAALKMVNVEKVALHLTTREFQLLHYLMMNQEKELKRYDLLSHVWGNQFEGDARIVDAYIKRLRARLPAHLRGMIQTLRGRGYRLTSDILEKQEDTGD